MNNLLLLTRTCFISMLFVALSPSAFAEMPAAGSKPAAGPMGKMNLSESQQSALREASAGMRDVMQSNMKLQEEIRNLTHSGNYDEKKVRELVQKHHKQTEDKIVSASTKMNAFYQSLSPEQKKQFEEMRQNAEEHRQEKMKEGMQKHMQKRMEKRMEKEKTTSNASP